MAKNKVPKTAITEKGLLRAMKKAAKQHNSVGEWAISNGITPQAVSAFVRGVQTAGLQIPAALGYRPQVVYLPIDEVPIQEGAAPRRPSARPMSKVDHRKPPVEKASDRLSRRERRG